MLGHQLRRAPKRFVGGHRTWLGSRGPQHAGSVRRDGRDHVQVRHDGDGSATLVVGDRDGVEPVGRHDARRLGDYRI